MNGIPCVRGRITLPLTGAWVADVVAEPSSQNATFPYPGGAVTVAFCGQSFNGVVRRASAPFGTTFARLIGGAGGLPTGLPALSYQNTTVDQVLTDLLSACGETLSATSDQTLLSTSLAFWMRTAGPAWKALANLVDQLDPDGTWRVLPDGTIWVGIDTWPPTSMESFELLGYFPQELSAEIFSDSPSILPGQSILGGEATSIEHVVEPTKIVTHILFRDQQLAAVEASDG